MLRRVRWLLPIALLLVGGLASARGLEPITSPNDDRDYQAFTLPNQLQVLLISDPAADQAAAALAVGVGSVDDPPEREGLAHFLEHLLFLGTEKYPEPGEYKQFLSAHGGSHNAYTAYDHTNYFFQVDAEHLEPVLDRFAQFFIAPLFAERYVENERQIVHSEYQSKLGSDGWRIRYAQRMAMNPEHPNAQFNIGSRDTLEDRDGQPIRDELLRFYRERYSANLMRLVVLGREPLPVLRSWVEERFAAVENRASEPARVEVPLFEPGRLPARLDVTPLRDDRYLSLSFPVPPQREHFRAKPATYIAHLLGHEGEGSLLALLRQRGWATSLWTGLSTSNRDEALFSVGIELTRAGLDQVDAIVDRVFRAIDLIEAEGIDDWRFEEQRQLAEIDFRFRETRSEVGEVRALAANMLNYPAEEVLRGPYLMEDYRPDLIAELLAGLQPDNLLLTVSARELETDSIEPWFRVPYRLTTIAPDTVAAWQRRPTTATALALPEPNPFIPRNLALKEGPEQTEHPERLIDKPGLTFWHRLDTDFGVPRAELFVSVRSPIANQRPEHTALTELYLRSVQDQLDTLTYPARLAGLNVQLYRHIRGFTLRISGYDDKQTILLEQVVDALRSPELSAERFARVHENLTTRLYNARQDPPHRQAMGEIGSLLLTRSWTDAQQLAALESLGPEDLRAFVPQLLAELELFALAYGNLTRAEAKTMAAVLDEHLLSSAAPVGVPRATPLRLTEAGPSIRQLSVPHVDSAAVLYFQGPEREVRHDAQFRLLAEILSSPYFEQLRTELRLGYIVYATAMPLLEVPGLAFAVQSPDVGPAGLIEQTERFLEGYLDTLAGLSEAELERFKASLRSRILSRDTTLRERAEYYWRELDRDNLTFDSREQLATAVSAVELDELIETFRTQLLGEQRRHLVVHARSEQNEQHAEEATGERLSQQLIEDREHFQAMLDSFPG